MSLSDMDIGWIEVLNLELLVHRQNKDFFFLLSIQRANQYIFETLSLQIINVCIHLAF